MIIAYINQNYNAIAVQKSLGLSSLVIQSILGYQIFLISFFICIFAFGLSSLTPEIIIVPYHSFVGIHTSNFIIFIKITSIALIAITIFLIPALNSIQQLSANSLFRNTYEFVSFQFSPKTIIVLIVLIFLMIGIFTLGNSLWLYNVIFLSGFLINILNICSLLKMFNHFFKKITFISSFNLILAKRNICWADTLGTRWQTELGIGISLLV